MKPAPTLRKGDCPASLSQGMPALPTSGSVVPTQAQETGTGVRKVLSKIPLKSVGVQTLHEGDDMQALLQREFRKQLQIFINQIARTILLCTGNEPGKQRTVTNNARQIATSAVTIDDFWRRCPGSIKHAFQALLQANDLVAERLGRPKETGDIFQPMECLRPALQTCNDAIVSYLGGITVVTVPCEPIAEPTAQA